VTDNVKKRRRRGGGVLETAPSSGDAEFASQLAQDDLQTRFDAESGQKTRTSLTAAEREVILLIADDEETWHVSTDSARLSRLLLRFCRRNGIPVVKTNGGYEFDLPRHAVRFQMRRGRQQLR
jgi:DNA-directed RNA polymerase specialized sigma24 family protein